MATHTASLLLRSQDAAMDRPNTADRKGMAASNRYDALMHLEFPPVRQAYTERDTILYALGVGAGDGAPGTDLDFLDERRLVALPTMAAVLASPGFWFRDIAPDLDHVRTVHASQRIELHAPLPVAATVEARTRVAAIYDKGAGRGSLVASERTIRTVETGMALASVRHTAFCRGDGGLGGPLLDSPESHRLPERMPDATIEMTISSRAGLIYRLSGDLNPLHLDPQTAAEAGFPAPIFHGLGTYGHIGRAIIGSTLAAGETIRMMDCRFVGFVLPGETLAIDLWRDGADIGFRASTDRGRVIDNGLAALGRF